MSPVTVVFVPGFWGGPAPFEGIRATLLKTYGYNTSIVARPSTGHAAPSNPTQEDDIKVIRAVLEVRWAEDESYFISNMRRFWWTAGT